MKQFGELSVELKSGIVFSVAAFVFSILAGIAGKVPVGMILLRAVLMAPVFFAAGFGMILVVKKYVPEVYEVLSDLKISTEDSSEKIEIPVEPVESVREVFTEKPDPGFSEFTEKDYERLQTVRDSDKIQAVRDSDNLQSAGDSGLDSVLNSSAGKLGKHIIVENQLNSYEPKLMAQAIRTMMSKDKD